MQVNEKTVKKIVRILFFTLVPIIIILMVYAGSGS